MRRKRISFLFKFYRQIQHSYLVYYSVLFWNDTIRYSTAIHDIIFCPLGTLPMFYRSFRLILDRVIQMEFRLYTYKTDIPDPDLILRPSCNVRMLFFKRSSLLESSELLLEYSLDWLCFRTAAFSNLFSSWFSINFL